MKRVYQALDFTSKILGASSSTVSPLKYLFLTFLTGYKKSKMMEEREQSKLFSSFNKGLVLDGMKKRLSLKDSFNHLALVSRTGGGKTTSFVIPNVFTLAQEKNSMVITDISGELYEKTSGYLKQQGYKIYVLNPEDLEESIGYNPLYYATSSTKIDELVSILIASSGEKIDSGSFWYQGAKTIISILIRALVCNMQHEYINLVNVRHLLNNYGTDGRNIKDFIDSLDDDVLYYEFKGFSEGNPQTILSILATANVALNTIGINDNLASLTSHHTINFDKFRKEKSVLYIKIPGQKQKQYSFLINIFYSQFFNYMMETLPQKNDLPVFCLLDEFGNMNIPNFDTIITTIRKYKISVSIILQDLAQIKSKYGEAEANTILNGGIASKLFYNGADKEITEMLEKILGKEELVRVDSRGSFNYKDKPIMSADEIRTMKDNEALFIMSNKLPAKIQFKPYYKSFLFDKYSKIPPHRINNNQSLLDVDYIDIYSYRKDDEEVVE